MSAMKPCPFCGGKVRAELCDDEGELLAENISDESGAYYRIVHHLSDVASGKQCPIATHNDEGLGVWFFMTRKGAEEWWNSLT